MKVKILFILLALSTAVVAEAGCKINLTVKNTSANKLKFDNSQYAARSGVKTKGGVWRNLKKGYWNLQSNSYIHLQPQDESADIYQGFFKCSAKRRWRITYHCLEGARKGNTYTKYFPGASSWTTRQDLTVRLDKCID